MTQQEKAMVYDQLIRESDILQRENSKLKSEYVGNIPPDIQNLITKNDNRISELVRKLESLFN